MTGKKGGKGKKFWVLGLFSSCYCYYCTVKHEQRIAYTITLTCMLAWTHSLTQIGRHILISSYLVMKSVCSLTGIFLTVYIDCHYIMCQLGKGFI